MPKVEFTVAQDMHLERADKILPTLFPALSRSAIQKAIEDGALSRQGKTLSKKEKLQGGATYSFLLPETEEMPPQPKPIPLDILYEDDALLVVNKPKGMVVHPAPGHTEDTLVNALLYHCQKEHLSTLNGEQRPGIVHRIDKDTSGLLMVAKTDAAHAHLAKQIAEHSFHREYLGVICGHLKQPVGTVEAPIGRNPKDRKKMAVTAEHSKEAKTVYETIEQYDKYSLMRFTLYTGRTHQIRVHMAYLHHALAGDTVYGHPTSKAELLLQGQCLHAAKLGFVHPTTQEYMEFEAKTPLYFETFLQKLQKNTGI